MMVEKYLQHLSRHQIMYFFRRVSKVLPYSAAAPFLFAELAFFLATFLLLLRDSITN